MYSIVSGQGETGAEIFLQKWGLVFLDVLNEFLVNGGLELGAFSRHFLLLLVTVLEEASSSGLSLSLSEGLVSHLGNVDSSCAHLGGGGDSVNLIDASEWDSIDLVWSTDEEQA
jgi:hypothetical protein